MVQHIGELKETFSFSPAIKIFFSSFRYHYTSSDTQSSLVAVTECLEFFGLGKFIFRHKKSTATGLVLIQQTFCLHASI